MVEAVATGLFVDTGRDDETTGLEGIDLVVVDDNVTTGLEGIGLFDEVFILLVVVMGLVVVVVVVVVVAAVAPPTGSPSIC